MKRKGHQPSYSLEEVKALVSDGRYRITARPARFVRNHLGNPAIFVPEIISSVEKEGFRKSLELDVMPGTYADVYVCEYDDEDWYVKFYVDEDGSLAVILSCNWEGALH